MEKEHKDYLNSPCSKVLKGLNLYIVARGKTLLQLSDLC